MVNKNKTQSKEDNTLKANNADH